MAGFTNRLDRLKPRASKKHGASSRRRVLDTIMKRPFGLKRSTMTTFIYLDMSAISDLWSKAASETIGEIPF